MRNQYKILAEKYEQVQEVVRGVKLTDQDIERLKQLYTDALAGKEDPKYTSVAELAKIFNINRVTVWKYLKQLNFRSNLTSGKGVKPWGVIGRSKTIFPPGQIEYVKKLLKFREESRFHNPDDPNPSSELFAYSALTVANMINKMIDNGQALEQKDGRYWKKFTITNKINRRGHIEQCCGTTTRIANEVEQELGYKRLEIGIRTSNGSVQFRGKTNKAGTRQQSTGPLGTNDPSYRTAMGRAQDINDQDYQIS